MRLVASDIDGTILDREGRISERTARAFAACEAAGIAVVFVTGRPARWLTPLIDQLGHKGTVICSNGALVYDLATMSVVASQGIPRHTMLEVRDIIRGLFPESAFAAETTSEFVMDTSYAYPRHLHLLDQVRHGDVADLVTGDEVVKFMAKIEGLTPEEYFDAVAPHVGHLVSVTHSAFDVTLLEMAPLGVNKAVTLAEYAHTLGIPPEEVVAFGDMPNDVEMLSWAGEGYAMSSGHPQALAATELHAPGIEDDGVAQVLERKLAEVRRAG
ncbi:HAD family hydrolase [Sinomonas sp. ASV322]|uniref:HAD family hydrolase n=1 Tax=Sinomonas sp. ASV322 TaxID=3041920 RepID=UPI0027DE334D|nr:HAD family hydrolase [Sinomonas sp. ASV322]MDQ4501478.1 HAD family hydrolase [Sinomonas sp. ASV322]